MNLFRPLDGGFEPLSDPTLEERIRNWYFVLICILKIRPVYLRDWATKLRVLRLSAHIFGAARTAYFKSSKSTASPQSLRARLLNTQQVSFNQCQRVCNMLLEQCNLEGAILSNYQGAISKWKKENNIHFNPNQDRGGRIPPPCQFSSILTYFK